MTTARASTIAALIASFPKLTPVGKVDRLNAAAKNIRVALKEAFPGVKFSVKSSRFSGGDSIDIRWTDGPIAEQVDALVGKYAAGKFDGMDDSYTYLDSAWKDAFGDARWVHTHRDNSDRAIASALRTLWAKFPQAQELFGDASVERYRAGAYSNARLCDEWLTTLVHRVACRRVWALGVKRLAEVDELAA